MSMKKYPIIKYITYVLTGISTIIYNDKEYLFDSVTLYNSTIISWEVKHQGKTTNKWYNE